MEDRIRPGPRYGLSEEDWSALQLSVGTGLKNRRLSPTEVAARLEVAGGHATDNELATALGLEGTTMLGRFKRLLRLPSDWQDMVVWRSEDGGVSFSVASEAARLTDDAEKRAFMEAALRANFTSG